MLFASSGSPSEQEELVHLYWDSLLFLHEAWFCNEDSIMTFMVSSWSQGLWQLGQVMVL